METQYRVIVWTAENVLAQNAKVVRRKPVAAEDPLRIRVRETQARRLAEWYEWRAKRGIRVGSSSSRGSAGHARGKFDVQGWSRFSAVE